MIPQTVPNRPTNGATLPTVARKLSRSAMRSTSWAIIAFIAVARRCLVPSRSTGPFAVERRHSLTPAARTFALGSVDLPCSSKNRSIFSALENACSNLSDFLVICVIFMPKLTMIVQVQTLASKSPIITDLTIKSASMKSMMGEKLPVVAPRESWSSKFCYPSFQMRLFHDASERFCPRFRLPSRTPGGSKKGCVNRC